MIKNPVLELMIDQGGKFERRLAELYFCADAENSATLENSFRGIFDRWEKLEATTNNNVEMQHEY
jgi:hypothetical protein